MNKEKYVCDLGIIGGTGIYDTGVFKAIRELKISTPYGQPSDSIMLCEYDNKKIAFLPRHGKNHRIPPHMINFRANIWTLKELGIKYILAPSAVGSLREDYKPGDIVIPDQFIDFTKNRDYSFYDGGKVCHISMADPFCPDLRSKISESIKDLQFSHHDNGAYICIEGPRFSTRAESNFYKNIIKADIIGMTLVPECILAKEAEICYASIATVTDYDVWANIPVSSKEVIETLHKNVEKIRKIISTAIEKIPVNRINCDCQMSLENALF